MMADVNQIITLGIGTPSGIPEFLTFGLQIGEVAGVVAGFGTIYSPGNVGKIESPSSQGEVLSPDGTGTIKSDRYG